MTEWKDLESTQLNENARNTEIIARCYNAWPAILNAYREIKASYRPVHELSTG
jgi:hypothetical protein